MLQAEEDLLVLALQNGNQKAFTILYRHYRQPLLRFAYKLANNQELAQDAVQDCWIKLTKKVRQLNDPRAFKSYLYKIVRYRVIDLLRQQQRRKEAPCELAQQKAVLEKDNTEQQQSLNIAINRLPAIEKQMIHLFYLDEMSLNDISRVVDVPVGTVKSRLNRARKLLKQKFELQID